MGVVRVQEMKFLMKIEISSRQRKKKGLFHRREVLRNKAKLQDQHRESCCTEAGISNTYHYATTTHQPPHVLLHDHAVQDLTFHNVQCFFCCKPFERP